jgi:hypothetical protein
LLHLFPLQNETSHQCYLCHRGADPALIQEISAYFRDVERYEVIVQNGSGLSISFPQFRQQVWTQLEAGCDLIVLLNKNFPGPVFKHTLGSFTERAHRELQKYFSMELIRVEDCACDRSTIGRSYIDLADAQTAEERLDTLTRSRISRMQKRRKKISNDPTLCTPRAGHGTKDSRLPVIGCATPDRGSNLGHDRHW